MKRIHVGAFFALEQFAGASALGQHAGEDALDLVAVPRGVVPVDGALQSLTKPDLGLPSKELLGQ